MNTDDEIFVLDRKKVKVKTNYRTKRFTQAWDSGSVVDGFRCAACGAFVLTGSVLAGVVNRNHCPYCLYSRHLDSHKAGDRLSACKARMRPIGLTLKKTRKKYGLAQFGELMIIHRCEECGKISLNRIAADDDAKTIFGIFLESQNVMCCPEFESGVEGIRPLAAADRSLVETRLFGRGR